MKGVYDVVDHPVNFAIDTVLIFVTGLIIGSMALLADLIVKSTREHGSVADARTGPAPAIGGRAGGAPSRPPSRAWPRAARRSARA